MRMMMFGSASDGRGHAVRRVRHGGTCAGGGRAHAEKRHLSWGRDPGHMLADLSQGAVRDGGGPFVEDRALIVGKVARLTLLPGPRDPIRRRLQSQGCRQWRGSQACLCRRRTSSS